MITMGKVSLTCRECGKPVPLRDGGELPVRCPHCQSTDYIGHSEPRGRWTLSENDRRFLRSLRIVRED